jgi:hydrogenase nickel incorporation protein HypB
MCDTCGCTDGHNDFTMHKTHNGNVHEHAEGLIHTHSNADEHHHHHSSEEYNTSKKVIHLGKDILSKNNLLAERNRGYFEAKNIKAFNLVSSPGSGKTTLLEKLILEFKSLKKIYIIEGDQQTSLDAQRIRSAGAEAIQINTGNGCHLDAHMINHAVKELTPENNSILFIENVGNLVCPALFDLGEQIRIVVSSTTEGEDKPLKYTYLFQSCHLCVLNKADLLPYLEFDLSLFKLNVQKVKPDLPVILVSAKSGEGLEALFKEIMKT